MVHAQAAAEMKADWIALDKKLREVERAQTSLEAQAIAVAKRQQAIATWKQKAIATLQQRQLKGKADLDNERANLRRIQDNERFARGLDNTSWAIERWCKSVVRGVRGGLEEAEWRCSGTKTLVVAIAIHWLVLFPGVGILGLRFVLSDQCLESKECREVLRWLND
ncbi:MAG: hypothetical protein ACRC62_10030 [Microcoleus sp.]